MPHLFVNVIPRKYHIALVPLLLAAFFAQAAMAWRLKAPTFDEPTHLAAGWSYLKTGDYRLNPEHPPLLKQWAALPLLAMSLGDPSLYRGWGIAHQGTFAHFFFFEGNDFNAMFLSAHLMMIALATLLGVWIYLWSRSLWGADGALVSLLLFAFSPNLLANSAIVGTDYGMASFGLLSLWLWARMLARPTATRALLAGLAIGLVLLSKFSAVILIPIWIGWWILSLATKGKFPVELLQEAQDPTYADKFAAPWRAPALGFWAGRFALAFGLAIVLVCAGYQFHLGALSAGLEHFVGHIERGHPAYLHGKFDLHGWWSYFPIAYLIKTPIPEMILIVWACGAWLRARRGWGPWVLLAAPWVYVLAIGVIGRVCIGYRYILPMVPLGMVMVGGTVSALTKVPPLPDTDQPQTSSRHTPLPAALLGVLCLWQVWGAVSIYPNPMTYFNELIGGPKNGAKWLSDSNIDWGQDLTTLGKWMEKSRTPQVYLAYFGTAEARRYGVQYARLPGYNALIDPLAAFDPDHPAPGVYAIFVTNLGGQYLTDTDTYKWFREREPDERLGNSVFIYRVTGGK